ncbi:hypothetical protein TSUD_184300 [Trifolium subterraneum]|uniref:YbaK/aminoacyl-tRNA synthetase-associated domain-containing protein n=1 Tax=Trifolium subterraneum TaxID=3900 RepID=A0A2Z6PS42_TRISU|nr:hypothetical protein TSUD_184300 [Trifolium subterraneum]
MEQSLADLERVQTHLLQRISKLEQHFNLPSHTNPNPPLINNPQSHTETDTVSRLSSILQTNGVTDFSFKRVASDYYDWSLESRRDALNAASIHHLCKSIVLVNTQAPSNVVDCSDRNNSKYYVVVVQYTARFNAEAVKNFLYSLNNGTIAKKKFNCKLLCYAHDIN